MARRLCIHTYRDLVKFSQPNIAFTRVVQLWTSQDVFDGFNVCMHSNM
jgi:hypothetical protein